MGSLDRASQPFAISADLADGPTRYSRRGIGFGSAGKAPDPFLGIVYCDDQSRRTIGEFGRGAAAVHCLSEADDRAASEGLKSASVSWFPRACRDCSHRVSLELRCADVRVGLCGDVEILTVCHATVA